jgi:hypothetical protein
MPRFYPVKHLSYETAKHPADQGSETEFTYTRTCVAERILEFCPVVELLVLDVPMCAEAQTVLRHAGVRRTDRLR